MTDWARLLEQLDEPPLGTVAEALADARDLDIGAAYDAVEEALAEGALVEEDTGAAFEVVRTAPDTSEPPETVEPGDTEAREAGPEASEPRGKGADIRTRGLEAFAEAIDFFNSQLDADIGDEFEDAPETPRQYYEDRRGWTPETISEKQLGYAPSDDRALVEHLMSEGFDGEEMQATGLFYADLTPHFQGRYVLPYFDEDGRPVYAISRSLNHYEAGHRSDPKGDQKYTKAIKTKDRSYVDEPIYGAETVGDDTDRLLVAGGIADAITLHEAGFACVSPVTTVRFKNKHEARVVELVDTHDIDSVYMLNDAERPSIDAVELADGEEAETIGQVLTIKQYGEGLRGAFGNAQFLLENDIDTYLADLPGGDDDLRKLDPDDYLKEDWGAVETLLRSAQHAESHTGYGDWSRARQAAKSGHGVASSNDAPVENTGGGSGLWELTFPQVSGVGKGDRVDNPLGHHGKSHEYFVGFEKGTEVLGYDHKYPATYNALTYLLCDADKRRADAPAGSLDDSEVFVAWHHAKDNGLLPMSDPVPYRGLVGMAVSEGLVDADDLVYRDADTGEIADGDTGADTYRALPPGTYNRVLAYIENEFGVDPGREPAGSPETTTPTADELGLGGEADSPDEAAQDLLAMMELQD